MPELRDVLERTRDRYPEPALDLDSVLRRHGRRQRQRRIAAGAVALTLVAIVLGGLLSAIARDRSAPADPAPAPVERGERIVVRTEGGLWNVIDPDGANPEPLEAVIDLSEGMSVAWVTRSSSGAYALVASIDPAEGTLEPADWRANLWVADASGGSLRRSTGFAGADQVAGMPVWSPDGGRIAFETYTDGRSGIAVIDADGGGLRSLDVSIDPSLYNGPPVWSPDGSRIALEASGTIDGRGVVGIFAVDVEDASVELLAVPPQRRLGWKDPVMSPDWTRIAFVQREDSFVARQDLYVMRVDGSGLLRLTDDRAAEGAPVWSPDGSRIAISVPPKLVDQVVMIAADGSDQGRPSGIGYGYASAWWPAIDAPDDSV